MNTSTLTLTRSTRLAKAKRVAPYITLFAAGAFIITASTASATGITDGSSDGVHTQEPSIGATEYTEFVGEDGAHGAASSDGPHAQAPSTDGSSDGPHAQEPLTGGSSDGPHEQPSVGASSDGPHEQATVVSVDDRNYLPWTSEDGGTFMIEVPAEYDLYSDFDIVLGEGNGSGGVTVDAGTLGTFDITIGDGDGLWHGVLRGTDGHGHSASGGSLGDAPGAIPELNIGDSAGGGFGAKPGPRSTKGNPPTAIPELNIGDSAGGGFGASPYESRSTDCPFEALMDAAGVDSITINGDVNITINQGEVA